MHSRTFGYFLANSDDKPAAAQRLLAILRYCRATLSAEPNLVMDSTALDREPLYSRPNGRQLIHHLRRGDHLVLADIQDLGRSAKDWSRRIESLWRQGVTMHFLDADPPIAIGRTVDKATQDRLGALIDQAVAESKSRRTRESMAQAKSERRQYSRRAPYGFAYANMPAGRVLIASRADRYWGPRVQQWRQDGWSRDRMLAELRRRKAKTGSGDPWTMRRLVRFIAFLNKEKPRWAGCS